MRRFVRKLEIPKGCNNEEEITVHGTGREDDRIDNDSDGESGDFKKETESQFKKDDDGDRGDEVDDCFAVDEKVFDNTDGIGGERDISVHSHKDEDVDCASNLRKTAIVCGPHGLDHEVILERGMEFVGTDVAEVVGDLMDTIY